MVALDKYVPQPDDIQMKLRGAPAWLFKSLVTYKGPLTPREIIICGPGGTGKSRGVLQVIAAIADTTPNMRILLSRSSREDMTSSTLVEWEECFPEGHSALRGPRREGRSIYHFDNGTEVACIGLDRSSKVFSTKWDIIYFEELTEEGVKLDDWELFYRGLRGGHPFNNQRLLIATCNPTHPQSWVRQRILANLCETHLTRHEDNPRWHNGRVLPNGEYDPNGWTDDGRAYMAGMHRLTGHRRARMLEGRWVASSGLVWDEWNEELHLVNAEISNSPGLITVKPDWSSHPIEIQWTFASFDWGYSDPGVMQVWGVDGSRRMWRLAEIYRTRESLDWWADRAAEFYIEFGLSAIVADPSRNDAIDAFNSRIARDRGHAMPGFCRAADNRRVGDFGGLSAVRTALTLQSDGHPSLFVIRNTKRYWPDRSLKDLASLTCLEEEVPAYIYKVEKDGKPNKDQTDPRCADHACFVAGTPIETERGLVAIENVAVGERVWTHAGLRTVVDAAMTAVNADVFEVVHDDGILVGTGNHPVWTQRGWVRIDALTPSDMLCGWKSKLSSTAGAPGGDTQTVDTSRFAGTSDAAARTCIIASGSARTAQSRRAITSTTGTETPATTRSQTWSYSLPPRTRPSTGAKSAQRPLGSGLIASGRLPWNGTDLSLDASGTESTRVSWPIRCSRSSLRASTADRNTSRNVRSSSARTPASRRPVDSLEPTTSGVSAVNAERDLASVATRVSRIAAVRARGNADVFNLTVEDAHTYFAGGVLVSNCDAMRYAVTFAYSRDLRHETRRVMCTPGTVGALPTWPGGSTFEEWWSRQV